MSMLYQGKPDLPSYILMQRREDSSVRPVTRIVVENGTRTVFVFNKPEEAEVFLILQNLGPGWEVYADAGVRYVTLNSLSALTRGDQEALLIPIWRFIDYLIGE